MALDVIALTQSSRRLAAVRELLLPKLVTGQIDVSSLDLGEEGREDLVVSSLIGAETSPESLLDQYDPAWRTRFESGFEVFTADDGLNSIRFKHDRR
jgi:hypothetical protein